MATPRNPLEAFVWGSGGRALTPEQVAREREIAAALTQQGADFSPVGHWLQGAARLGHSAAGAFRDWRASEGERAGREGFSDRWSSMFGGGASPVAEALTGGASSPALDAAGRMAASGDMQAYRDAIASIESAGSGDYGAIGPTNNKLGRALGRYQIMEANIAPWSRKVLGREVTPEEFMASPEIQDAIFDGIFGGYVDQFGPEGAAQAWFAGPGSIGAPGAENRRDVLGTSVSGYVDRFNKAIGSPVIAPAGGGGSMQVAQAGGTPSIAELLALSGDPSFGYASPAQQQIVQSLMGQQLQQMDPAYQQNLALGNLNLRRGELELEQMLNPPAPFQPRPLTPEELAMWGLSPESGTWVNTESGLPQQLYAPDAAPSNVQEYEYYAGQARNMGVEPIPFAEWDLERRGRSATQVNVNSQGQQDPLWGNAPSDHVWLRDDQGRVITETDESGRGIRPVSVPIAGSRIDVERAREAQEAESASAAKAELAERYGDIVVEDIDRAVALIEDSPWFTTGIFGSWLSGVGGTPANRLNNLLNTVKANAGFDRLQAMRDSSPTGGALGQVSNIELGLLQSAIGSLEQSNSSEDLVYNLRRVQQIYSDIIHGPGNTPIVENPMIQPDGSPTPTGSQPYTEGTIIENEVGQRMVMRNGNWEFI